jgi:hypothetical protein
MTPYHLSFEKPVSSCIFFDFFCGQTPRVSYGRFAVENAKSGAELKED